MRWTEIISVEETTHSPQLGDIILYITYPYERVNEACVQVSRYKLNMVLSENAKSFSNGSAAKAYWANLKTQLNEIKYWSIIDPSEILIDWNELCREALLEINHPNNEVFWQEMSLQSEFNEAFDHNQTRAFFNRTFAGETTASRHIGDIVVKISFTALIGGDVGRIEIDRYPNLYNPTPNPTMISIKTFDSIKAAKDYTQLVKLSFLNVKDWTPIIDQQNIL